MSHGHIGLFPATLELRKAQLFDHELHAGFVTVLPVPQLIEDFDDGFDAGNQFIDRREIPQDLSDARSRTQASPCDHAETERPVHRFRREQPDIMDRRESAVVPTTGKSDLEFAGQALIEGIPQQMIGHRLGIRCNVEHLSLAHASQMAPRHIPDGVGAGFTCRQTHFGQSTHDG